MGLLALVVGGSVYRGCRRLAGAALLGVVLCHHVFEIGQRAAQKGEKSTPC